MNEHMDSQLLNEKISSIIGYLYEHQESDGGFRSLRFFRKQVYDYAKRTEHENWYYFGKCPFGTAIIVYHLHGINHPKVAEIKRKGCEFLQRGFENGVVRYVPAYDMPIEIPTDVDDTCLTMVALSQNGYKARCNVSMILSNTDGQGNFYTWLIPRLRHLWHPRNFWWLVRDSRTHTRRMKSYGTESQQMKQIQEEYRDSSELAVTANVLLYLGIDGRTVTFLKTLIRRIKQDDVPLQYYANLLAHYFSVARLHDAGVKQLECLKQKIVSYIVGRQEPDGEVEGPFNTALAALTMIYFDCWGSESLDKAIRYVAFHEMHEKGWRPFHYNNDLYGGFYDGVAELTATFYLEVLFKYQRHLSDETPVLMNTTGQSRR